MNVLTPDLLLLLGRGGRGDVAPDYLSPNYTVTRAQPGGAFATSIGFRDGILLSYGPNTPRFNGPGRRLLVEEQRTNLYTNPRGEGAATGVVGSGGAHPATWGAAGAAWAGLTQDILATPATTGQWIEIRLSGTATAVEALPVFGTGITVLVGETYTGTLWAASLGAPQPPVAIRHPFNTALPLVTISPAIQRFVVTTQYAGGASNQRPFFRQDLVISSAYDFSYRWGRPQLELGPTASSLILPAVGTPAASTRGAEIISALLSALRVGPGARCVVRWVGRFDAATNPHAAPQTLFSLHDGTANNLVEVYVPAGSGQITANTITASVPGTPQTIGPYVAGVDATVVAVLNGAGGYSVSLNGAAPVVGSAVPHTTLTTVNIGSRPAGANSLNGEVGSFSVRPL